MSTVICNRANCKFRVGTICTKLYPQFNLMGCCSVWFDGNGNLRPQPFYQEDVKPQDYWGVSDEAIGGDEA